MSAPPTPLVLMMAGGTGGHVYPALAVARELLDRGCRVEWVGTLRGLEARVVPEAGITLHCLVVRGVRGKNPLWKILGLFYLMMASLQALWLVLRLAPQCVIGMGGYVAGPAGVAAWLLRKPLLIHEQNAVAGTTNRLLAPLASRVMAGFPGAFRAAVDHTVVGNPVRRELLERAASSHYNLSEQRPLRLLVLGGSLGAKPINDLVPPTILELTKFRDGKVIELWHQCGNAHLKEVQHAYDLIVGHQVKVTAFIEDMAQAYDWADLVVCRAGALTVSELSIMGCPAILVPLPHAIDDHQTANARFLSESGGGTLLPQNELTPAFLANVLKDYLSHPERLANMASAASELGVPGATKMVCDYCEELINDHG